MSYSAMLSVLRTAKSEMAVCYVYLSFHPSKERFDILMDSPAQDSELDLAPDDVHS